MTLTSGYWLAESDDEGKKLDPQPPPAPTLDEDGHPIEQATEEENISNSQGA